MQTLPRDGFHKVPTDPRHKLRSRQHDQHELIVTHVAAGHVALEELPDGAEHVHAIVLAVGVNPSLLDTVS